MLIAHLIYRLDYGGLENGLVNLVNRLPERRFRHAILCLAGFGEFRRRVARDDVEVVSVDKREGKDPGAYLRVLGHLRRLRPDVVHTRNLGTIDLQWLALAAGVRHRVHGEHGFVAEDPRGLAPRGMRIRRACRPAIQRYVAMSRDIAAWLERDVGVPRSRIRQIYSGVDTTVFRPDGAVPADLPWVGPARGPLIVFGTVGRFDRIKNQIALIEALRDVAGRDAALAARLRLIVAGDGPERPVLQAAARSFSLGDQVWFAGARDDVPDLLRAMDVFVLPSRNEGISNTILEAMASALPVIAARVGGNPELIADGETGVLYDPAAPTGLAAALEAYASDALSQTRAWPCGAAAHLRRFQPGGHGWSVRTVLRRTGRAYGRLRAGLMCGIAGIFDTRQRREVDRHLAQRMNDALAHRGPDGEGIHFEPGLALCHRRLAIIDLATGQQPLYNEDGSVVVVYNGEIYNYQALIPELQALGHVFHTRSDTEVIVHAWEAWGEAVSSGSAACSRSPSGTAIARRCSWPAIDLASSPCITRCSRTGNCSSPPR